MINTYTEAVQTVDPKQAVGKLHHLWVNFAKFYEGHMLRKGVFIQIFF